MYKSTKASVWQGRVDEEENTPSLRWHQVVNVVDAEVQSFDKLEGDYALIGFCSDQGVERNKGRIGAKSGPQAIRESFANQAVIAHKGVFDLGDIVNEDQLEKAQQALADLIEKTLAANLRPLVLGGGHEIGYASFKGVSQFIQKQDQGTLGILNFDAHLDLRNPVHGATSGTPFRQVANDCEREGKAFHYAVIGFNPVANTAGLMDVAKKHQVTLIYDTECDFYFLKKVQDRLKVFLKPLDYLYLSICLDVFSRAFAPGVSAPQALGIEPQWAIHLIQWLKAYCEEQGINIILNDIAEMNPRFDEDAITAKLAARLLHEIMI